MKAATKKKTKSYLLILAVLVMISIFVSFVVSVVEAGEYFVEQVYNVSDRLSSENLDTSYTDLRAQIEAMHSLASALSYRANGNNSDLVGTVSAAEEYFQSFPNARIRLINSEYQTVISSENELGEPDLQCLQSLIEIIESGRAGNTPVYTDGNLASSAVAFYAPVAGNDEVLGIVMYLSRLDFEALTVYDAERMRSDYSAIVNVIDGTKLVEYQLDSLDAGSYSSFFDTLSHLTDNSDLAERMRAEIGKQDITIERITIRGESYVLAMRQIDCAEGLVHVDLYPESRIYSGGFSSYRQYLITSIALIVTVVLTMLVSVFLLLNRKESLASDKDPILGCDSLSKFRRVGGGLIASNRYSKFALIYLDTNRLTFIRERFGAEGADEFLHSMAEVISQTTLRNEAYGYVLEDNFVMLIHYNNQSDVEKRLKLINVILNGLPVIKNNHYSLKVYAGVLLVSSASMDIQDAIDRAILAHKSHKEQHSGVCVFFDDSTRALNLRQADIESRMEYALNNGEFRLFLQPKYNIKTDKMDGAEVLVRWYNEETGSYQSPAEFVPIFELNGFIVNMDHYVYEEACKLISKMRSLVTSTICISVNVSRVTAMAPDFLKFYLSVKNKYNISNGVITLEFTESFAYENYDMMKSVIISLKNNGINSSLDDFGSGYSSYNILKELPIYELKLDRFFIDRSGNERRDRALLSMMINFCNEMGIKITQEGVEQIEDLLVLREMGCDVVQGYIYSKPIMSSDFMDFIKHTTFLDVTGIRLDE